MANTNFFASLTPNTTTTNHTITLRANTSSSEPDTIWAGLTDEQLKELVEFLGKMNLTFHRAQDERKQASAPANSGSSSSSSSSSSKKKSSGKASAPKKDKPFWSYIENAPLQGSVKLSDFYEMTSSKSGHQAVIEVSKELAPCWWYFMNAVIREYNSTIGADMFPLKSYNHKIYCDRKAVNGGASFMFADSAQSTECLNRFIEVLNSHLTATGKTSVKKGQAVYAKADAERKAEHEARKARKAQA